MRVSCHKTVSDSEKWWLRLTLHPIGLPSIEAEALQTRKWVSLGFFHNIQQDKWSIISLTHLIQITAFKWRLWDIKAEEKWCWKLFGNIYIQFQRSRSKDSLRISSVSPISLCTCLSLFFCLPPVSCPRPCLHLVFCPPLRLPLVSWPCPRLPLAFSLCLALCLPLVFCPRPCLSAFSALSPSPGSSISLLLSHPELSHFSAPPTTAPPCDGAYSTQRPLSPPSPWQQADEEEVKRSMPTGLLLFFPSQPSSSPSSLSSFSSSLFCLRWKERFCLLCWFNTHTFLQTIGKMEHPH